jgi:hypothetical protein
MENEGTRIALSGVGLLDYRDMTKGLDPSLIEFRPLEDVNAQHGELGTGLILIALVPSALQVLASYLLRKHDSASFVATIEEIRPDGRSNRKTIHFNAAHSQAPEGEIIKQLGESLGHDFSSFLDKSRG